ncbi:threonine--tRNA ligase [Candidatus Acetothermia bacterium]|jgi:threonyl-tRNA synthetase|nr:threonine--tRNA ligase [Candidatus Acetothermia bacterium]MCI2436953.1 threonine--tRNA ligase [Candidatus Acetothermia bacterium]
MIVKLPDGRIVEHHGPATLKDVLVTTNKELLKTTVGAKLDGEVVDFHRVLPADANVELISLDSPEGAAIYRHSYSHIMAQAVRRLFPGVRLAIGPAIEDGFYYDFDVEKPFTPEDLEKIEAEMKKIVKENYKFERLEVSKDEARHFVKDEPYKLELLDEIPDERVSFYRDGDFIDLCRGPHILSTGQVKHFKLLSVAGAYWRGDETQKMLQRIYGTAFATKEALEQHLQMLEEAKKRDHRKLGKELEIFFFDEEVGPGLPLWFPKGAVIIEELEKLAKETEEKADYLRVRTPHICKESMYLRSGHLPYYQESMYPPMEMEGVKYYLKPMNCPHHHKIFAALPRSYRDLPLRLAEYGTCYRYEKSGELFGLMRVRSMQMNDAHLYCSLEQFESEFLAVCQMYLDYFKLFGIEKYLMRFSTHDPKDLGKKYVNEPELWKQTEEMVRRALKSGEINYVEVAGEAAFYGPKIDVQVWSAIGREFTLATNQVDFAQPRRFELVYKNAQGQDEIPICIHRAPLSTHERFIGFLIEHYAGAFPVWLAPVQAVVLPITDRQHDYAEKVLQRLKDAGIRAELDSSSHTLNYRIRHAQMQKVPYMLVVGEREAQNEQVAVRLRNERDLGAQPLTKIIDMIAKKIASRDPSL